jgi:SLT domain-containing protein
MKNDLLNVFKAIANTVFVAPINFIINTVIDKGINSLIHGVGDVFGQNWGVHVNPVTPFATGGVVPGVGNRDTVPALLMPGEVVVDKARVRAAGGPAAFGYGPKANTRARMTSGGIPAYGLGDVIGNIGTAIGAGVRTAIGGAAPGVSNVIGHAVTWARGTLANTAKGVLNSTIYPLADSVSKSGIFGQVPHDIAHKIGDTLVTWIAGKDSSAAGAPIGYKPSAGVAQWDSTIISVLQALGQPVSWLQTIEHRMNQESGGNPNAINLTDSNAKAGDPSRGLMQTIMSTFLAYAPKGATAADIYMPYDNIYAGTNYAIHRYGSIAGMNRPGGYANGAIFNRPTLGVMGESGDELLLPLQRRGRVKQLLNRAGLSSPQSGTMHKHYNLTVNANEFSAADLRKAFKQLQALDGGSA